MECVCLFVCLLLLRVSVIHGVESIQDVTEKLNDMNIFLQEVKSSMSDVRGDVVDLEKRFDMDLKFAMIDLKHHVTNTIVPTFVRNLVEHALEDILRTRSVDSMINSHVMYTLERLKKEHNVLKNNLRFYVEHVSETERENRNIKAELAKVKDSFANIQHVNEFQASELNEIRTMFRLEQHNNLLFYAERLLQYERENIKLEGELAKVKNSLVDVRHVNEFQASQILNLTLELNETRSMVRLEHHDNLLFYAERFLQTERENIKFERELAKVRHNLVDIRHVNEFQASEILNLSLELNETSTMFRVEKQDNILVYAERFLHIEREHINIKAELVNVKHSLVDFRQVNEFQASEILNLTLALNETRAVCRLEKQTDSDMATVSNTIMSRLVNPVASSVSQPQYNMSRVLYLSYVYKSVPKQLSLKNNNLQTFPLSISSVRLYGVIFEPTSSKIIFSVGDKNNKNLRICSSDVEGGAVKVIRYGIKSFGLAVDTTRNVIFMTTEMPTYTISRMRPDGSEFRVVADLSKYRYPRNIAVAPDKQLIYSAHYTAVIETSYDGVVRRTIYTGSDMYALDYDNISHNLYFNNRKTLKRWSRAKNESTTIYMFKDILFSLKFHRNSVYAGFETTNELGVVYLNKEDTVYWKLAEGQNSIISLCLVP